MLPKAEGGGRAILRPGSGVAQARSVILTKGEPVHINDILAGLGKEPTRENRASLTSSIAAYVRRGEVFTRSAPNTFGLMELGHETTPEEDEELPAGFGTDEPPVDTRRPPGVSQASRPLSPNTDTRRPTTLPKAPPPPVPRPAAPTAAPSRMSDALDDDIPF
jgi:hypothetical protein